MMAQVLFFNVFSEKDPHLNAAESVFHKTFYAKKFLKKLSFFSLNSKNPFQDVVYYRKLEYLTL